MILFGSRARGEEQDDSDWDLLILLNKPRIESTDFEHIAYPLCELGWKEGEQFSPKLYTMKDWKKRSFTPFYKILKKKESNYELERPGRERKRCTRINGRK